MRPWPPPTYPREGNGKPGPRWRGHRRWFFWRFAAGFGLMVSLVTLLMGGLAWLLTGFFGGGGEISLLVLAGGCSLALILPVLVMGLSWTAFQRLATPVAQVMAVAEAVGEGDLSARVESAPRGRMGQLTRSVNQMVAEMERTVEQRRQLTADIAHELRTPLQIIQGNLEGVLDGIYEPTPDHLENTLEETRLLARLIDDLATLSLAEAGQLPLVIEPVPIDELLTDVQTSFSGQAESAGIELRLDLPADRSSPQVEGDVLRLNQVLGNLVANALRHTPAGGTITLRGSSRNDAVRLEVVDTGEGISAADLPHIFDRFWRGDRARTHAAGVGGGLGLAIAEQLIQAHGGTIAVASVPGEGTTFTITLPPPAGRSAAGEKKTGLHGDRPV